MTQILVLSLIAGLFVTYGLWLATLDTKPMQQNSDTSDCPCKQYQERLNTGSNDAA
jgi:hypothetical protein